MNSHFTHQNDEKARSDDMVAGNRIKIKTYMSPRPLCAHMSCPMPLTMRRLKMSSTSEDVLKIYSALNQTFVGISNRCNTADENDLHIIACCLLLRASLQKQKNVYLFHTPRVLKTTSVQITIQADEVTEFFA